MDSEKIIFSEEIFNAKSMRARLCACLFFYRILTRKLQTIFSFSNLFKSFYDGNINSDKSPFYLLRELLKTEYDTRSYDGLRVNSINCT